VEQQTPPSTKGTNGAAHDASAPPSGRETASGQQTTTAPETAGGGRAADGKFVKGHLGGPGNPFARQTAALRKRLINAVTNEDIDAIAAKLIAQAKEGDVASAKLLFGYIMGKPAPAVDPDALNLLEWNLVKQSPVDLAQLQAALSGLPVDTVCTLLRYVMPCLSANASGVLAEALQTGDVSAAVERLMPRPQSKYEAAYDDAPPRTSDELKRTDPSARVKSKPSTKGPNGSEPGKDPAKRRRAEVMTSGLRQRLGQ
jgi:hypothetical protein